MLNYSHKIYIISEIKELIYPQKLRNILILKTLSQPVQDVDIITSAKIVIFIMENKIINVKILLDSLLIITIKNKSLNSLNFN